jgi:hypothetical protein
MDVGREFLRVFDSSAPDKAAIAKEQPGGFAQATTDHVANFLECVRTRKEPVAPIEKGFHAALILQLANMSIRQGKKIRWNASTLQAEG